MNKEKDIVEYDCTKQMLTVNGQQYVTSKIKTEKVDGIEHKRLIKFKPRAVEETERELDELVEVVSKHVELKELLREVLRDKTSARQRKRALNQVKKKKPINKHEGCLGLKIGNQYISLAD